MAGGMEGAGVIDFERMDTDALLAHLRTGEPESQADALRHLSLRLYLKPAEHAKVLQSREWGTLLKALDSSATRSPAFDVLFRLFECKDNHSALVRLAGDRFMGLLAIRGDDHFGEISTSQLILKLLPEMREAEVARQAETAPTATPAVAPQGRPIRPGPFSEVAGVAPSVAADG